MIPAMDLMALNVSVRMPEHFKASGQVNVDGNRKLSPPNGSFCDAGDVRAGM
jgi:hypothetical protein